MSAYRGDNLLIGRLGEFLKAVKSGAVPPGSALVVESMDRISRQGIDQGYDAVKALLKAGITLVTLSPEREFDVSATKSLSKGALEIQLILERAAEESERKAARLWSAWEAKRKRARADGTPLTRARPAWVGEKDGRFVPLPERAAVVRTIFRLAADGYGTRRIAVKLIADKVPPFAPESVSWGQPYVSAILRDRRAVGEYRPRHRDGTPAGDVIGDYFPVAVSEAEWLAAREGALQRRGTGRPPKRPWTAAEDAVVRDHPPQEAVHRLTGRTRVQVDRRRKQLGLPAADKRESPPAPRHVSLFTGLLKGAGSDDGCGFTSRVSNPSGHRVLTNTAGVKGRERMVSFHEAAFEAAVLSQLREVDPREVLPAADAGPDPVAVLAGELAGVDKELAQVRDFLRDKGFSPTIADHAAALEARKGELDGRLTAARAKASRLRLRAVLRRMVAEVRVLIVPRVQDRLAAVTVAFHGGAVRNYQIAYRPPRGCGGRPMAPGRWVVWSAGTADPLGLFLMKFDLRQRNLTVDPPRPDDKGRLLHTDGWEEVEQHLQTFPLDLLDSLLREGTPVPEVGRMN